VKRTSVPVFLPECCIVFVALAMLVQPAGVRGQAVSVRVREGFAHGFLLLRTLEGAVVASGELTQTRQGARITSRLVFRFKDGSLDDEATVYLQGRSFRLLSDRHVQKGPSFPHSYDASIDTISQQVSIQEDGSKSVKIAHMDLPSDLSNGLVLTLVRHLHADGPEIEVPYLAVSSKPRLVKLAISSEGQDRFKVGRVSHKATRYVIKAKLGGVTGVVAPIIGKQPADSHVWVTGGIVPTVVRVDAPLYAGGPVWSIQLASPIW
jgi:hypothetical protein